MTVPDPQRSTRVVLALGILGGAITTLTLPLLAPEQVGLASNVYYYAAEAALAGEDVYAVHPPDLPGYTFLYPPVVVLAFVPHVLLGGPTTAFVIQTVLNLAAALATAWFVLGALDRRAVQLARIDRLLVVAFSIGSVWAVGQLVMGQTTLWLALGVAAGLDALDRDRSTLAGVAFALAALVKVFPAVLGLWLLRRGRYRAVGVALATGLAGLALGAVVLGADTTAQYLTEVLVGRHEGQGFEGTPSHESNLTTARRQVAALVGGGSVLVTPLTIALVAPIVAYCYRDVSTDARRLTAVLATIVGTLLVLPLQPLYFSLLTYPLVVTLFVVRRGWPRRLLLAGTVGTFLVVNFELVAAGLAPFPEPVAAPLRAAARRAFVVVLPATVGMWLLLAGCVALHHRVGPERIR